jgi:hypothetical protein
MLQVEGQANIKAYVLLQKVFLQMYDMIREAYMNKTAGQFAV